MASTVRIDGPRVVRRRGWIGTGWWWWPMALLTAPIAVYSLRYVILGDRVYVPSLAASFKSHPWAIWVHTAAGPLALVLGPLQFLPTIRTRWRVLHRRVGMVYISAATVLAIAGLYLAAYSAGGWSTHLGFGGLALGVLVTTTVAYRAARRRAFDIHRRWMIRSYALIYAAVTLRILLPGLLGATHGDFLSAYRIVSWLCWVPNLVLVEWWLRRSVRPSPVVQR